MKILEYHNFKWDNHEKPTDGNRYACHKKDTCILIDDNSLSGCFRGDLQEWEDAIRETHKDNEKHLKDYLEQVGICKILIFGKGVEKC